MTAKILVLQKLHLVYLGEYVSGLGDVSLVCEDSPDAITGPDVAGVIAEDLLVHPQGSVLGSYLEHLPS